MKKRTLSLLLALAVVLSLFMALPITTSAATLGGYTYDVADGKATITGADASITGNVTIPSTLGGYPVVAIGNRAFSDCDSLTSIVIPDSIISIGDYAFSSCSSLTSIIIPDSVTSIGIWAFAYCSSLTSITLPDSVTSVGGETFYNCSSLTSIILPHGVTSIGTEAFGFCSSLTNITIPDSVTSIGNWAFQYCTSLKNIIIPDNVTSISNYAFEYCTSLTSITIPNSVTSIGSEAFSNCSSLTSITIPDRVTTINWGVFRGCKNLTTITVPDSVTNIYDGAFSGCSSLTGIALSDSVAFVGEYAFDGCTNLADVYYTGSESDWNFITIGKYNDTFMNATKHFNAGGDAGHTHTMTPIAAKASTCTVQGNNAYYYCKVCGKYYKDASGTIETTVKTETLALAEHTYKWEVDRQATETETGIKHEKCTVCGDKRNKNTVILATGTTSSGLSSEESKSPGTSMLDSGTSSEGKNSGTSPTDPIPSSEGGENSGTGSTNNMLIWLTLVVVVGGILATIIIYIVREKKNRW